MSGLVGQLNPVELADLVLALVADGSGDAVFIEPAGDDPDADYTIAVEQLDRAVAAIPIDGARATATIARLAFIANLDLAAGYTVGGTVRTAINRVETDVSVTLRPGTKLRAEVIVLPRKRAPARASDPAQPSTTLGAGSKVGSYTIVERLGEGGMGTVYVAEHAVLGSRRALKVLRRELVHLAESDAADRFVREARAAARVHHPNIVQVFDFGYLADERPYIVMELLGGESLADRMTREGALQPPDAIAIVRQLAEALSAAHDAGVVHADVTPGNAFLTSGDPLTVKLLDFGLAELVNERTQAGETGQVLGTPHYISPEQLRELPPTDRSDQYSLGAVLFEMLAGHPPYDDEDLRALCMKHVQAPIPEVTSPHGPLPPLLVDVVTSCLQKSPQARFPGMRALITALDAIERVTDRRGWRRFLPS